jgi:LysM domain
MVGNHWTPYNPPDPSTYPAGAKTYTIVAGDTLWALGAKFYGNAYLWPQLWEANTWITDAHWIYPGDTLLVEGEGTTATTASGAAGTSGVQPELTTPTEGTGPASLTGQMPATLSAPVPLGTEADIYCYAYIGDPNESLPNTVDSFEDIETKYLVGEKNHDQGVGTDEIIYIKGGTASGIVAGETYIVVAPSEMVLHPVTKAPLGRKFEYRAQVKILCASEDKATAVVSQACTDVRVGDRLKPLPSIPIPIARTPSLPTLCDPPSGKTTGYIVEAKDFNFALGEGMLVQVNLGRDDTLQPGDFLTVFRDNPVPGAPRRLLGEIGILTAESHTATARIVSMHFSMQVGDRVEIR